jgi:hypothetical protein
MDDNEEDEDFFQDDFDDVTDRAWAELEQNAIQLTQPPPVEQSKQQRSVPPSDNHSKYLYQHAEPQTRARQPLQLPGNYQLPQQQYVQRQPHLETTDGAIYEDADVPTPVEEGGLHPRECARRYDTEGAMAPTAIWRTKSTCAGTSSIAATAFHEAARRT